MFEDNRKDFCKGNKITDYAMISFIASKLRVGIIGYGKAGRIKASHFKKLGCFVEIISKEPCEDEDIKVQKYTKDFISDKHLIIIAVDNDEIRQKIKEDCDSIYKMYIDCSNFKEGIAVVPVQKSTDNITVALNTNGGNPKAAVFLTNQIKDNLKEYDKFVNITTYIRNKVKEHDKKDEILKFIFCKDFYFFIEKEKWSEVLAMFYGEV